MSIAAWITQQAQADPAHVAFHFEGSNVTYGELDSSISATAAGLLELGVNEGDRVGLCGLNRIETFEVFFGAARIGAIFVPFNNRLTAAELGAQIEDSDPSVLLGTDGFHELLATAAPDRAVIDLDATPIRVAREVDDFATPPQQTVLMVYTSGTTGRAKGAMLSHDALTYTVLNGVEHQRMTAADRTVAPLPTFHVGGLNIQTLPTLFVGGQVLLMRRFDPGEVLRLIYEFGATQTLLVPAMLAAVANHADFADTELSTLRGVNSGSSVVPAAVMQPFFDRGVPVGQVYGTTETGPTAVVLDYDDAEAHIGSCGRAAPHTELRLVGQSGEDVSQGEPGELWVRGPNIFTGYWRDDLATAEAFAPGGWFRTGDVGFQDADGFTYISDRITDVVISGGENIYPAELEPVLQTHPAIADVAVIGERNERWGETPVAVVVLIEGATLTIDELRSWCEGQLATYKQPTALREVESLPRTALGKVKKHELRANPPNPEV